MRTKILSLIALLLTIVTQGAWAQTWTEISSADALNSAIADGANIRLADDITLGCNR